MKGLLSTGASRAWLGLAFTGLVIVVLVVALMLVPRLTSGQQVLDAAAPAFSDARIAGTRAGVDTISQYVDVVDPLLTRRGGARRDVERTIGYVRRKLGLSAGQVRRILRREAPNVEALTRALPLAGVAAEIPRLTTYLATIMGLPEEELAAILEQDFPRISRSLAALAVTADGWYDVPGIDGLTRLRRGKPVRTVPGLRKYLRDDVVPLMVAHRQDVQSLAGSGGIGYIPFLLLALGVGLLALGLLQARRAAVTPTGMLSWGVVAGVGVLLLLLVVVAQYFPRLGGAQDTIVDFEPVFVPDRVRGMANGVDTIHEAISFGDPLMTAAGGAAREAPQLYRFVAQRTGRRTREVRAALRRRAPRTAALLSAIPLTRVATEVPRLMAYFAKSFRMSRREVEVALRRRAPGLTRALLTLPAVAGAWNALPRSARMTRFDGVTAVRTMNALDGYLREDLVPVLVDQRTSFDRFASGQLPLDQLAPAVFVTGLFLMFYGAMMMQLVVHRL